MPSGGRSILAFAFAVCAFSLAACNAEDVRSARQRSGELQKQFNEKKALAARYPELRREVEAMRAELAAAPTSPTLPDLPPPPTKEELDEAAAATFPAQPAKKSALLGPFELRQLESQQEDAEDEIGKIDSVLENIQALAKLRRKLDAAKLAVAAQRAGQAGR